MSAAPDTGDPMLLDPGRRFVVRLRHHAAGQFGPFEFGAGGIATIAGGRQLYRLVVAFGPDVESVVEETPSPAAPTPPAEAADPRIAKAKHLRASGKSWSQIGRELGLSGERARQLATRGP